MKNCSFEPTACSGFYTIRYRLKKPLKGAVRVIITFILFEEKIRQFWLMRRICAHPTTATNKIHSQPLFNWVGLIKYLQLHSSLKSNAKLWILIGLCMHMYIQRYLCTLLTPNSMCHQAAGLLKFQLGTTTSTNEGV